MAVALGVHHSEGNSSCPHSHCREGAIPDVLNFERFLPAHAGDHRYFEFNHRYSKEEVNRPALTHAAHFSP